MGPYDGKAWADTVTKWYQQSMSSPTLGRGPGDSTEPFCSTACGTAKTDLATDVNSLRSEVLEDSGPQSRLREGSESSEECFYDCEGEASWAKREENDKPLAHAGKWDVRCKSKSVPSPLHSQQNAPTILEQKMKSRRVTTV